MLEFDTESLAALADELEDVADDLETVSQKSASDSRTFRGGVEEAVVETLTNVALTQARRDGQEHVGNRVSDIEKGSGQWRGNQYTDGLVADSEVVLAHEYGSGVHNGGSAYKIPGRGDDGPIAINSGGEERVVEYVVHPGVEGQGFIAESVGDSLDDVGDEMLDRAMERIEFAMQ